MKRRALIRAGTVAGAAAIAGCFGSQTPPPRHSEVFDELAASDGSIRVDVVDQPILESRQSSDAPTATRVPGMVAGALAAISPVGVARAAKGGGKSRGATGRGRGKASSAPSGWGGHAKYHGGDYDDWYDEHEDEVSVYEAEVATLGIAYLGSEAAYEDSPPGPGADEVTWDRTWDMSGRSAESVSYEIKSAGWYRVGSELVSPDGGTNFGWECVDFKVEPDGSGYQVDQEWKVSPRL